MNKSPEEFIFGLVTACEWYGQGNPTRVKICADGEVDYFVSENELSHALLKYLRTWVFLKGRVLNFDSKKIIDIEEISQQKLGGSL